MKPPFFIIGNPRSGTTLLRLMLANHSDLLVAPECGFAVWFLDKYRGRDITDRSVILQYAKDVMMSKKFDTWGISENELNEYLLRANAQTYGELASAVYDCYGAHIKKSYVRWGDKNNFYLNHIQEILAVYPSAQFIHIVRDGRDVACSYRELAEKKLDDKYAPNLSGNIEQIALEWKNNIERVQASFSKIPREQWMEVRFTDLVFDSEKELEGLCTFLGVDYDPQMMDYHKKNSRMEQEPMQTMAWKQKTLQPPQASTVGRYKKDLTPKQINEFEHLAGEVLDRYKFGRS